MEMVKMLFVLWRWRFQALLWLVAIGSTCTGGTEDFVNDGFNFLVIGDWGGQPYAPYRTYVERQVADRMGKLAEAVDAKFVVALGDNFYYDGVADTDDFRFKDTYEDVYTAPALQVPWYIVAGNHDHHRNVSAQISYSQVSKRWNFPEFYYSKLFKIPGSSLTLELVLIDTVILCGDSGHDHHHQQPEGPRSKEAASNQLAWLESILKNSTADFLLVGGHYPVWSVAEHGPTHCLLEHVRPLLEKYRATAYLSGHDHNLQHIKEDNSTVEYFVSGCANFINLSLDHMTSVPKGSCKFHWADPFKYGGFAVMNIKEDSLSLTFVDSFGEVLYTRKMLPRNAVF